MDLLFTVCSSGVTCGGNCGGHVRQRGVRRGNHCGHVCLAQAEGTSTGRRLGRQLMYTPKRDRWSKHGGGFDLAYNAHECHGAGDARNSALKPLTLRMCVLTSCHRDCVIESHWDGHCLCKYNKHGMLSIQTCLAVSVPLT